MKVDYLNIVGRWIKQPCFFLTLFHDV